MNVGEQDGSNAPEKVNSLMSIKIIVQGPRAPGLYLFSDGQNMYNRVVLVCTVNLYASLGRRSILWYQVPQIRKNCTHFTYN